MTPWLTPNFAVSAHKNCFEVQLVQQIRYLFRRSFYARNFLDVGPHKIFATPMNTQKWSAFSLTWGYLKYNKEYTYGNCEVCCILP